MAPRASATTDRKPPAEILVGPGWIVEVYRLEGVAFGGEEAYAARRAAECAWEESRGASGRSVTAPAVKTWAFAACAGALAALAAWLIVR
jgi:hypothetical protein